MNKCWKSADKQKKSLVIRMLARIGYFEVTSRADLALRPVDIARRPSIGSCLVNNLINFAGGYPACSPSATASPNRPSSERATERLK
jgi:hypothetical protein